GSLRLNRAIVGMAPAPERTAPLPIVSPSGPGGTPGTNPGGTPGTTAAGTTSSVARASTGGGTGFRPWMSADGRYLVFDSDGTKVLPGSTDTVHIRDVYLYDRVSGAMERISDAPGGVRASVPTSCSAVCGSQRATISADGRYVAFWSNATNLVANDTNNKYDAFLFDRSNKQMTLISKGPDGSIGNDDSRRPVVSRDGRYVVFESAATNLVPAPSCGLLGLGCAGGDNNKGDDVFVYEVATGKVTRVSTASDGTEANGVSNRPSLSGDGTKIVFNSTATNLVGGVTSGVQQVYMKDLTSGATTLVSSTDGGAPGDKASASPSMSADGRWVSFDSKATNFNPADAGGDTDIYVKDLQSGHIEQASVQTGGGQATGTNGASIVGGDSTISGDGRFVAFWSDAASLVPG